MKKNLAITFVLVLMCSSLASAGFFSDSLRFIYTGNLITGDTVAEAGIQEGEEGISEPAPEPEPEQVTEEPSSEPVTEEPSSEQTYQEPTYQDQPKEGCWVGDEQVPCPGEDQQQYNNQPQYNDYQSQPYQGQQRYRAPEQNQYQQTVCGDGICEGDEKYGCQDDCGFTSENPMKQFNGDYQKELYGEEWCAGGQCCPDGICDDFEQKMGACSIDCSGTSSGGNGQYGQQYGAPEQNTYVMKEEIDATEALTLVLKLEEIRMKLGTDGGLYEQIQNLNEYCESKGTEDCSRYENALAMMTETSVSLETLMSDLKSSIEANGKLTQGDLMKLKNNIHNIVDNGLLKITYALIGVDITIETIAVEETYVDYQGSYDNSYVAECGNGLCEPDYGGEDSSNCPNDCMGNGETDYLGEQPIQETPTEEVEETETTTEEVEETETTTEEAVE